LPQWGRALVAHQHETAQDAHVRGTIRPDADRGVVVVEGDALAREVLPDGLAGPEVERGEEPRIVGIALGILRVHVDETVRE
jgi:hypothetical protein